MPDGVTIYSDDPDSDTLGGRLSRARDAAGMSVGELARRIGVEDETLEAWESDRDEPRANRLSMLAGVLDVSLSWLLHGVGAPPREDSIADLAESFAAQLERLRQIQDESADIIARLESDLRRLARGA